MTGWPQQQLAREYQPYASRKNELSVLDGCILWRSRSVIPPPGRDLILNELHETHPGTSKMKALARSYSWWPGMDMAIERTVKSCQTCQESRPAPAVAPLHLWEWPSQPWSRLHLNFAGPFLRHMYLVLIDAHSKWLDIHVSIKDHRSTSHDIRYPWKIVTDNDPLFTSEQFNTSLSKSGIVHVTTAPYHPSSNGLPERGVNDVNPKSLSLSRYSLFKCFQNFLSKKIHSTGNCPWILIRVIRHWMVG